MAGCSNEEPLIAEASRNANKTCAIGCNRSVDDAVQIAEYLAGLLDPNSRPVRKIASGEDAVQVIGGNLSRSGNSNDTPSNHRYDFGDYVEYCVIK